MKILFIVLVCVFAASLRSATADRDDTALVLARMCVAESGWTDLDVCSAQIGVITRRASRAGVSVKVMARAYSAPLRRGDARRPWIQYLSDDASTPDGWGRGSWARHHALFVTLLRHTESVLAGEVPDPCPMAWHFGGHMDRHRMSGWTEVCADLDSGRPRQMFWGYPAINMKE